MRSTDNTEENKSRIGPECRLQLADELTKFQNTVDRWEVDCSFTSSITRHYKHTDISITNTTFSMRTAKHFLQTFNHWLLPLPSEPGQSPPPGFLQPLVPVMRYWRGYPFRATVRRA